MTATVYIVIASIMLTLPVVLATWGDDGGTCEGEDIVPGSSLEGNGYAK